MTQAIGIIEIQSLTAALEALDAMLKAADVNYLTSEKKLGGRLVTIIVEGSVSDVIAAIEAGKSRGGTIGRVVAAECIAAPHQEIMKFLKPQIMEENLKKEAEK